MRKHVPALALCVLSLAPVLTARAADAPVAYRPCDRKPSASDTDAARGLFQAGKVSYEEADYPRAISLWRDAYERDCTAVLLLRNLANAYEKAGNLDAAIITLDTFIKRDPENPEIPTLQKRIENMRRSKAAVAPATSSAPAVAPPRTSVAPPPPTDTAPLTAGSRPLTPLFVVGGGAVVGIIGVVVLAGGQSKVSDAAKRCPSRDSCSDLDAVKEGNDGRSQSTLGGVVLGVGAAGMVGGLVWYLLSKPETKSSGHYLTPAVAPGYGGLSFGGKF